jgi:signal transduction histidine kinase
VSRRDHRQRVVSPFRIAGLLVLGYLVICVPYILFSGVVAARFASSVEELQRIEMFKGLGFIVATAAGLFIFSWLLLRRIARDEVEILRQRDALVVAERNATAGVFASSIGHDINNLLIILKESIRGLQEDAAATPTAFEGFEPAMHALNDLERLARRLVFGGRRGLPGEYVGVDLGVLLADVVEEARGHISLRNCTIEVTGEKNFETRANPVMVRQLLLNLILNAAEATEGRGLVRVGIVKGHLEAILEVHDNGPGVPKDKRNLIFEPFYTSKDTGTGLGLLSVKVYAEAHRGTVEVTDSPLGGALFRVYLPTGVPLP